MIKYKVQGMKVVDGEVTLPDEAQPIGWMANFPGPSDVSVVYLLKVIEAAVEEEPTEEEKLSKAGEPIKTKESEGKSNASALKPE